MIIGTLASCYEALRGDRPPTICDCSGKILTHELVDSYSELLSNSKLDFHARIIISASMEIRTIAFTLAAWRKGFVIVPAVEHATIEFYQKISTDCNAQAFFHIDKNELEYYTSYVPQTTIFDLHRPPRPCGTDLAVIFYSSGTSGIPKGIIHTHSSVISAIHSISSYLEIDYNDSIACLAPLSFDYGLYQVLLAINVSCIVYLIEFPSKLSLLINLLNSSKINILPVIPTTGSAICSLLERLHSTVNSVRLITNTGGHLNSSLERRLEAVFPIADIIAMYGLTECKRALYLPARDRKTKKGSVGIPMPGLDARVFLSESRDDIALFREAPHGIPGELFVRGASLMQGYTFEQDVVSSKLIQGKYRDDIWMRTGDIFTMDSDGYFYFQGRTTSMIKQDGVQIIPKDLEVIILDFDHISDVCVLADPGPQGEERAHAFIVLKSEFMHSFSEIRTLLKEWITLKTGSLFVPKLITVLDEIPLNRNGKPDQNKLLRVYSNGSKYISE